MLPPPLVAVVAIAFLVAAFLIAVHRATLEEETYDLDMSETNAELVISTRITPWRRRTAAFEGSERLLTPPKMSPSQERIKLRTVWLLHLPKMSWALSLETMKYRMIQRLLQLTRREIRQKTTRQLRT